MLYKNIEAGSIPKLLLRYFAEIIIIFLGITISFLFEQWREERQQQKELIELSESLLTDVDALKVKLKHDLDGSTAWIDQLDSLRMQRISNSISDGQLDWFHRMVTGQNTFMFDPYSPTYMSAVSSGLIHEFPDSIKNQLYELYRVQLPFFQLLYNQQYETITDFRDNTLGKANEYLYHEDVSKITLDLNKFSKEVQRPVYGNFINQIILAEKFIFDINAQTFDQSVKLENSLREYIHKVEE